MNKALLTLVLTLLAAPAVFADARYEVDPVHSEVSFRVRHFLSETPGRFNQYDTSIVLDPKALESSSVSFTVAAESIDTDHADRDTHLRSEDFFWVEKHPTLSFVSEQIRRVGDDQFLVTGTFSLRGVEKRITVPVTFFGFIEDPWGGERAGFATEFTINRKEFGLVWNKTLDSGGVVLGDDVKITLNLELVKQEKPS